LYCSCHSTSISLSLSPFLFHKKWIKSHHPQIPICMEGTDTTEVAWCPKGIANDTITTPLPCGPGAVLHTLALVDQSPVCHPKTLPLLQ
jgi:hypothetical protein